MRAKRVPSDPALITQQWVNTLKKQPRLALASYVCALLGSLLAVHDFHHYNPDLFGFSTAFLGLALVLYLVSLRKTVKRTPPQSGR
jgi:urea transporter